MVENRKENGMGDYEQDWKSRKWSVTSSHETSVPQGSQLKFTGSGPSSANQLFVRNPDSAEDPKTPWLQDFTYDPITDTATRDEVSSTTLIERRQVLGSETYELACKVTPHNAEIGGTGGTCWVAEDGGVKVRNQEPLGASFNHNQTLVRGAR
jgi:hypothetical protein